MCSGYGCRQAQGMERSVEPAGRLAREGETPGPGSVE